MRKVRSLRKECSVAFLGFCGLGGLALLLVDGAGSFLNPGHDEEEADDEADGRED